MIVLSDALWRQAFHANPGVIGQSVKLDDDTVTVVGVMPADFRYPYEASAAPLRVHTTNLDTTA